MAGAGLALVNVDLAVGASEAQAAVALVPVQFVLTRS